MGALRKSNTEGFWASCEQSMLSSCPKAPLAPQHLSFLSPKREVIRTPRVLSVQLSLTAEASCCSPLQWQELSPGRKARPQLPRCAGVVCEWVTHKVAFKADAVA